MATIYGAVLATYVSASLALKSCLPLCKLRQIHIVAGAAPLDCFPGMCFFQFELKACRAESGIRNQESKVNGKDAWLLGNGKFNGVARKPDDHVLSHRTKFTFAYAMRLSGLSGLLSAIPAVHILP